MTLESVLETTRYQSYVYAYPHKTAYRRIEPAVPLADLWAGERRDSLFLYLHVPFCEQRCGFCNLFTRPVPKWRILTGKYAAMWVTLVAFPLMMVPLLETDAKRLGEAAEPVS